MEPKEKVKQLPAEKCGLHWEGDNEVDCLVQAALQAMKEG